MSHPAELIDRIQRIIERDYPPQLFRYITERFIDGTRMAPDIHVLDGSGKVVCAVEIGYTRPEKLTSYRGALKIPDVRWYDKAGNLHGDVREHVSTITTRIEWPEKVLVLPLNGVVMCEDCLEEWQEPCECDEPCTCAEDDFSDDECYETISFYITDGMRQWAINYCDACASEWLDVSYPEETLFGTGLNEADIPRMIVGAKPLYDNSHLYQWANDGMLKALSCWQSYQMEEWPDAYQATWAEVVAVMKRSFSSLKLNTTAGKPVHGARPIVLKRTRAIKRQAAFAFDFSEA